MLWKQSFVTCFARLLMTAYLAVIYPRTCRIDNRLLPRP